MVCLLCSFASHHTSRVKLVKPWTNRCAPASFTRPTSDEGGHYFGAHAFFALVAIQRLAGYLFRFFSLRKPRIGTTYNCLGLGDHGALARPGPRLPHTEQKTQIVCQWSTVRPGSGWLLRGNLKLVCAWHRLEGRKAKSWRPIENRVQGDVP